MKIKNLSTEKLWTAQFIKIISVSVLVLISYQMQIATLPLYIQHIGGNRTAAGLMMSVFTLSALLFRPLVGNLCDYKGRKTVLVIGVGIFTVISIAYNFAPFIWLVLVFRFIHGASFSAYSTAGSTITSDVVPSSRIMEGIGYYGVSGTIAAAAGPALGLLLISKFNYNVLFWVTAIVSAIGFLLALHINYEGKHQQREHKLPEMSKMHYFEKSSVLPSLVMLFIAMAQISIIIFLPSFSIILGIKNIGLFFTIQALTMMLTRPIMGRLSDKFGAAKFLLPGMVILVLSFIMMGTTFTKTIFLIIGILNGLGYGIVYPVLSGITIKLCPQEHRGAANSTFYSAVDLGYGIGSFTWGALSQYAGFPIIYLAAACSVGISLIIYILKMSRKLFD